MPRNKIRFDRDRHVYLYEGKELPGITRRIGKRMGKSFPSCLAEVPRIAEAAEFGTLIHEDVEYFLSHGVLPGHPASNFVCTYLDKHYPKNLYLRSSEVLVSDYNTVATAIDIVAIRNGEATIFDIKTGNFDREYCSFQLGIGKMLLELDGDVKVKDCFVINTKEQFVYKIIPKSEARCRSLLGI